MPATIFGRPLRLDDWASVPPTRRLVLELVEFLSIDSRAVPSLIAFWHHARTQCLVRLPHATNGLSLCLNEHGFSKATSNIELFLFSSSLMMVRDTRAYDSWSLDMVPIPSDFAGFDDDPDLESIYVPPIVVRRFCTNFELCSGTLVELPQGSATIAAGLVAIPRDWIEWMLADGLDLYQTFKVLTASHLPDASIEGAYMANGMYLSNATGLVPTFVGSMPWDIPNTTLQLPLTIIFLRGVSPRALRILLEQFRIEIEQLSVELQAAIAEVSVGLRSKTPKEVILKTWHTRLSAWCQDQVDLVGKVRAACLQYDSTMAISIAKANGSIFFMTEVPSPGRWPVADGDIVEELQGFRQHSDSEAFRVPPFIAGCLEVA